MQFSYLRLEYIRYYADRLHMLICAICKSLTSLAIAIVPKALKGSFV